MQTSLLQRRGLGKAAARPLAARPRNAVVANAATRKLWAPDVVAPDYLKGELAGDYGWDPLGLGSDPKALKWYRQAELQHARWAMLGCAGVLVQEIVRPDVWFYEAALPKNLPAPFTNINYGGLLGAHFALMHWVEVRRFQDIRKHGSVNDIFVLGPTKFPNPEPGYPGGVFDPLGMGKGANLKEMQTKEIKNGRLAMVAFMGFIVAAQATGKGPLAALSAHLSSPGANNWTQNIGTCHVPQAVDVQGLTIPLTCLWPAGH